MVIDRAAVSSPTVCFVRSEVAEVRRQGATDALQRKIDGVRRIERRVNPTASLRRKRNYSGITTISSRGMASRVARSTFKWAMTSSGGVWVSHSESERSI